MRETGMKYFIMLFTAIIVILTGCGNKVAMSSSVIGGADGPTSIIVKDSQNINDVLSEIDEMAQDKENEYDECECADDIELPAMLMTGDTLYYDTAELSDSLRCGMMDGQVNELIDGIPRENGQFNFGSGSYSYQFGVDEDTVEVRIGDEWHIFKKYEKGIFPDFDKIVYQ